MLGHLPVLESSDVGTPASGASISCRVLPSSTPLPVRELRSEDLEALTGLAAGEGNVDGRWQSCLQVGEGTC